MKATVRIPGFVVFLALTIATLALAGPAGALETVSTFAADCTTPKSVFQLGDTVCGKVTGATGDLGNIWFRAITPGGATFFGSPGGGGNTVVTTDPQNFTFVLPTSGLGAERGVWKAETANVGNSLARVVSNFRVPRMSVIGVHRDSSQTSFVRNSNTTGFADGSAVFGQAGDIGFWGDWAGTGLYTPGFYRPTDGTFHLSNSAVTPAEDIVFQFGPAGGGLPVVGDWVGDGKTRIGVRVGNTIMLRNTLDAGPPDTTFDYGLPTDQFLTGDWDGDGVWTIGVYRDGVFFLRNQNSTGIADLAFAYGLSSDTAVGGNWNAGADGTSKPGIYRPSESTFYLRNTVDTGGADTVATFGISSDAPELSVHNEAPVVTAGGTLGYTENQAATAIDPAITITDMDNGTLIGATVNITANCNAGEDVLSFANTAQITASGGGCSLTLTGTDTVANYQTALRNVKYSNSSDTPNTSARTVTWQVNDGSVMDNLSVAVTSTINVGAANDAPVLTAGATISYTEGDPAKIIDNTITVTDPDNPNLASATVQITANFQSTKDELACPDCAANGLTANFSAGTLSITNSATLAVYQAVLRTVTYRNTGNNPGATGPTRTITWIGSDGTASSSPVTSTINITDVNTAPIVTAGGTLNYTENQAATVIDATVTVTDDGNIASATVQITSNCTSPQDVLGFINAFSITNGGYVSGTCTLTLNGPTTPANFQSALRAVTYQNTSDNPATAARTVTWTATDTGALSNTSVTSTINVTAVNDAPVLTAGGTLGYTENQAATAIDTTITVNDADSANLQSATVQITGNCTSPQDQLGFVNNFGVTNGGYVNGTCTLTLNGPASPANFQSALRAVTYQNTSDNPATAARTVTWIATDGVNPSLGVTSTINVTAVNDPPVVTAGATLGYTEDQAATVIDNTITITDPDSTTIQSATVQITSNCTPADDVLSFVNGSGVTNSGYVAATCTLSLTGPTTLANFQTALRNVKYNNTSQNPITAARTVTWIANDGAAANNLSTGVTSTINVTAVNDTPVAQNKSGAGIQNGDSVQANMKRTGINANLLTGATDPDNGVNGCTVTFSVASISNGTNGTVSNVNLAAGTFDFEPTPGFTGAATVSYTISDNASDAGDGCPGPTATSATATITLTVNGPVIWFVNPAVAGPGVGNLSDPFKFLSGNAGVSNDADDVDAANQNIFLFSGTHTTGITLNSGESLIGQGVSSASDVTFTSFDAVFGITPPTGTIARPSIAGARPIVQGTVTLNTNSKVRGLTLSTGATTGLADPAGAITGVVVSEVDVTTTTGTGVNLSNVAGTFTFTGLTTGGGTGANLTGSNGSATFNFTGVAISSGANAGFAATGGGTLNITGANNTITSTTGTALNVSNTTIGASGVTFKSIAANGAVNGIVLNTTGATAGLTVSGDGTANNNGSGGIIQSTTGDGILLTSTRSVNLNQMNVQNGLNSGITGTGVTNFTLNRSNVTTNGNSSSDDGLRLGHPSNLVVGVSGTVSITNSNISGNAHNNVHIRNAATSTIDTLTVSGSSFNNINDTTGANAFLIEISDNSVLTQGTISGNTFSTNSPQRALEVQTHTTGRIGNTGVVPATYLVVSGNTFTDNGIHASFTQDGSSNLAFKFQDNGTVASPMVTTTLQAVNVFSSSTATGGTIVAAITGNHIGNPAVAGSGSNAGSGIRVAVQGRTAATLLIDNNVIRQVGFTSGSRGMDLQFLGPTAAAQPITQSDITITNNQVQTDAPAATFPLAAIFLAADNQGSPARVRANIQSNTVPVTANTFDYPTFDGTAAQLIFKEVTPGAEGQLVDAAPGSASAQAELASHNTGAVFGDPLVSLIAGPITTPP